MKTDVRRAKQINLKFSSKILKEIICYDILQIKSIEINRFMSLNDRRYLSLQLIIDAAFAPSRPRPK